MVSEHYRYNTSCTILFSKITVRIQLDARIRTILALTGDKLIEIYFLHLLSVTMHLRQGKKVSILLSCDVNFGSVTSR
jgi:hypothetical protein